MCYSTESKGVFFYQSKQKWLWKNPGFPTVDSAGWFRSDFVPKVLNEITWKMQVVQDTGEMEECFGEGQWGSFETRFQKNAGFLGGKIYELYQII